MLADPTEAEAALSPTQRALLAIRRLKAELAAAETARHAPVAIVGMSCRLPGAPSIDALWSLLTEGREGTGPVPRDRWDADALYHPDPTRFGRLTSRRGGFLDGLDRFDPHFFGISSREAPQVDPRQRLVLELTWEALEDAGIPPATLAGSNTATLISVLRADYEVVSRDQDRQIETSTGTGMASTIISNRLAYVFDLRGPSMTIDTACSGSLVGMHLACRDLRAGTADLALVGGVAINLLPWGELFFSRLDALASDGRCKTFDDRADGIVRSEGAAMIVLRRLDDALAAGDRIYAVIRGSAVNQDGRSNGMMAPNGHAQRAVLAAAYADARVEPATVQYVEAHGTGTRLGDPIEVEALDAVLAPGRAPGDTCRLGSIKTNIGHTGPVAGVAGVIKTALCLHHRELVPTLHFTTPTGRSPSTASPSRCRPSAALAPARRPAARRRQRLRLRRHQRPRRARSRARHRASRRVPGRRLPGRPLDRAPHLRPRPAALRALVAAWRDRIAALAPTTSPPFTDSSAAPPPPATASATAPPSPPAPRQAPRRARGLARRPPAPPPVEGPLVFVFSGQGASWFGMGRDLYTREPVFRAAFDAAEAALVELGAAPLRPRSSPRTRRRARRPRRPARHLRRAVRARRSGAPAASPRRRRRPQPRRGRRRLRRRARSPRRRRRRRLPPQPPHGRHRRRQRHRRRRPRPRRRRSPHAGRGGDLAVAGNNRPAPPSPARPKPSTRSSPNFAPKAPSPAASRRAHRLPRPPDGARAGRAHRRARPPPPRPPRSPSSPPSTPAPSPAGPRRRLLGPQRARALPLRRRRPPALRPRRPVFIELAPTACSAPPSTRPPAPTAPSSSSMHRDTPGSATMAERSPAPSSAASTCRLPPSPPGPPRSTSPATLAARRYWLDQIPVHDPPPCPGCRAPASTPAPPAPRQQPRPRRRQPPRLAQRPLRRRPRLGRRPPRARPRDLPRRRLRRDRRRRRRSPRRARHRHRAPLRRSPRALFRPPRPPDPAHPRPHRPRRADLQPRRARRPLAAPRRRPPRRPRAAPPPPTSKPSAPPAPRPSPPPPTTTA
ncbi:MAG: acyltransferase domain-containing protein [Myxococcales bacterium]|nr:acyltransferase domain-containing protein [Myxococcales bacterium]